MSKIAEQLGIRIRDIRKEKGLSQEELAHRAELHTSHMGQLERGEKSPTIDSLEKIVNALNISFEELFRGINSNTENDNSTSDSVIRKIIGNLENKSIQEQETAFKLLKLFFSWKESETTTNN